MGNSLKRHRRKAEDRLGVRVQKAILSTFHGLKVGDEAELEITEKSRDGRGLGRLNGLLVFVSGASPGEKVRVRIVKLGIRHAEAEVIEGQKMATAKARA